MGDVRNRQYLNNVLYNDLISFNKEIDETKKNNKNSNVINIKNNKNNLKNYNNKYRSFKAYKGIAAEETVDQFTILAAAGGIPDQFTIEIDTFKYSSSS